jgi:hypothetical protein
MYRTKLKTILLAVLFLIFHVYSTFNGENAFDKNGRILILQYATYGHRKQNKTANERWMVSKFLE